MKSQSLPRSSLFIAAVTLFAFFPVFFFPFHEMDDHKHIFQNPLLNPVSLDSFIQFWKEAYFSLYIPVTYTVWAGVALIAPRNAAGVLEPQLFHALNLAVHALNVFLVYRLTRRLEKRKQRKSSALAFFVALLFAIHPLQVEAVAWIAGLKDTLCVALGLTGLLLFLDQRRCLSLLLFVASLLAKPTAVVFAPLVFFFVWYFEDLTFSAVLKRTWPWFAIALGGVGVSLFAQPPGEVMAVIPFPQRVLGALGALGFYLVKWLVPFPTGVDYGLNPDSLAVYLPATAIFLGLLVYAFKNRTEQRLLLAGLVMLLIGLFPSLGLVPFHFQKFSWVSDRYAYSATPGFALVGFLMLEKISSQVWRRAVTLAYQTVLVLLCVLAVSRWSNSQKLMEHTLSVNPRSQLALVNLSYVYWGQGKKAEAGQLVERAADNEPQHVTLNLAAASMLANMGERARAARLVARVLTHNPGHPGANKMGQQLGLF